jgi:hypothetical protein
MEVILSWETRHLLELDQCKVHLMGSVVGALEGCGTEVEFILPGYTGKLQVLDVGINKPFKEIDL